MTVHVAYDDRLLGWHLAPGHPSNPIRAKLTLDRLREMEVPMDIHPVRLGTIEEMLLVHSPGYLFELLQGFSTEWEGERTDLSTTARLMFGGTMDLVDRMLADPSVNLAFAPQGAKHHAHRDSGSGFCVLGDFAAAAIRFRNAGKRVAVLDWDAHHGDGTEDLLIAENDVITLSIHDSSIFPGTGHASLPEYGAYNWSLPAYSGNLALLKAISEALKVIEAFKPDVLLVVHGADGHVKDPLSSLRYTTVGLAKAAELTAELGVRQVLLGGAGGYKPFDVVPEVWSRTVRQFSLAQAPVTSNVL